DRPAEDLRGGVYRRDRAGRLGPAALGLPAPRRPGEGGREPAAARHRGGGADRCRRGGHGGLPGREGQPRPGVPEAPARDARGRRAPGAPPRRGGGGAGADGAASGQPGRLPARAGVGRRPGDVELLRRGAEGRQGLPRPAGAGAGGARVEAGGYSAVISRSKSSRATFPPVRTTQTGSGRSPGCAWACASATALEGSTTSAWVVNNSRRATRMAISGTRTTLTPSAAMRSCTGGCGTSSRRPSATVGERGWLKEAYFG